MQAILKQREWKQAFWLGWSCGMVGQLLYYVVRYFF